MFAYMQVHFYFIDFLNFALDFQLKFEVVFVSKFFFWFGYFCF